MFRENERFKDLLLPAEKSRLVASVMPQATYQRLVDMAVTKKCSVSRLLRLFTEEMLRQLEGPLERETKKLIPDAERSKAWRKRRKSRLARPTRKVRK